MKVRSWVVAAFSLGTLAASASTPTAVPKRYRLDIKTFVVQDLTALGQGEQKQEFANAAYVTLSATDSAGGQAVALQLDSLVPGEGSPFPPDAAKGAAGLKWHGFRQPSGRVERLILEGENPIIGSIEPALLQLLPPMKRGMGSGQSWTDTTDTETNGLAVRTVTNFQTAAETLNGARVIRLAGAFSSATSGQQATPQGSITIDGTGSGTNVWMVGTDGSLVSATHSTNQSLSVTVAQLPEPIPVTVKIEGSATLLE